MLKTRVLTTLFAGAVAFATIPQADPAVERQMPLAQVAKPLTSQSDKPRIMPFCSRHHDGVHCVVSVEQKQLIALLVLRAAFEKAH